MYTEFYKLNALPFQLTPDPRFFFGSSVHNRAMAHLTYGLNQGEGFIIITGEVGAGKTTLVGYLLATVDASRYVAAKIVTTHLGGDDMLRMVAAAFGVDHEGADKATLLGRIEGFLTTSFERGLRCLLVVDEAQNLSVPALEELRMLSNFQVGEQVPLQSFLLGQPQFRNILASKDLDQLRQRVIAAYHLDPLSDQETQAYVEHRLRTVGWNGDPEITAAAFTEIYRHTEGVPRRINTLCSRLLLFGFLEEQHRIDGEAVAQVAEDLRQESEQVLDLGPDPQGSDPQDRDPSPRVNGAAGGVDVLSGRLEVIEQYVRSHDRTIRRALKIAAQFLDGQRA
jgi:putative secretion ATPase (PEP-CTERM system associated)